MIEWLERHSVYDSLYVVQVSQTSSKLNVEITMCSQEREVNIVVKKKGKYKKVREQEYIIGTKVEVCNCVFRMVNQTLMWKQMK